MFKNFTFKCILVSILVGISLQVQSCTKTEDCVSKLTPKYICNQKQFCEVEGFKFTAMEITGLSIIAGLIAITNVGGVGAGSVVVPTTMVFLDHTVTDAIPHARVAIMTGCLVSFLMTGFARSKSNPDKLDTSFSLAASVVPLLLGGTQIGVILTPLIPRLVIGVLLTFYLLLSLRRTYTRVKRDSNNSNDESLKKEIQNEVELDSSKSTGGFISDSKTTTMMFFAQKSKLQLIKENVANLFFIVIALGLIVLALIMQGGHSFNSIIGIQHCSKESWIVVTVSQIIFIIFSILTYKFNKSTFTPEDVGLETTKAELKVSTLGEQEEPDDLSQLHLKIIKHLIGASYIIGIVGGMLGIGGGLVISIYMVTMGLNIGSIAAFSIFIVLLSSTSATLQFIIRGDLKIENTYQFIAAALIGSLIANTIIRPIIRRNHKSNAIVWLLFAVLCIACVVLPTVMIKRIVHNPEGSLSFGQLC